MSILKTTQVIKVKVAANGTLQPLSSSPVVLKNTVREDILLSQLNDVVANTAANGAYLVYNAATNKYEVKVVSTSIDSLSNFDSSPGGVAASNGDIVIYNTATGKYEVKPLSIALSDLTNINAPSPADGYLLVYNGNTGVYDVREVVTNVGDLGDVVGIPVDGATLVYNATTNKYDVKILDSIPSIDGSTTPITIKFTDQSIPLGLSNGELAYSNTTIALYIGDDGVSKIIGGEKYVFVQRATPGILSANATLIADSNNFVDAIKTESLVVGNNTSNTDSYTSIRSISNFANSTQLGESAYGSNSELVTSSAIKTYVDEVLASGGAGGGGTPYVLPIANASSLGGVRVGPGLSIDSITGVLSTTGGGGEGGNGYTLPIASPGTLGGIKIGSGLSINGEGVVSVSGPGGTIGITAEDARDQAANLFLNGTHSGITFVYDDFNDRINATVTVTGGGANNLNALTDVTLVNVSNNDVLVYDAPTSQWKNYKLSGTPNQIGVSVAGGNVTLGLANNLTVAANLSVGQHLAVTNTAIFANGITVAGGGLTLTGNALLQHTLTVSGGVALQQTLSVAANTSISGGLSVANNTSISNNLAVGNTLFVSKQATFGNTVVIRNTLTVNSSANVNGDLAVANQITATAAVVNTIAVATSANVGVLTIQGNTTLGSNNSSKIYINAELASSIIPDANNIYSLGTPERRFKDVYVSGGTIFVDEVQLSSPPGGGLLVNDRLTVNGVANVSGNTDIGGNLVVVGDASFNGNILLGDSQDDTVSINGAVNTSIIPSSNNLYDLGTVTKYFNELYTTYVNAHDGNFAGNLHVEGNLTVVGNLTSLSVATVQTNDTIIKLAANNIGDILDIGLYGVAGAAYYGLVRDASDGKFKLFATNIEPTSTVDTTSGSFAYQTLVAYLESGGITTNSSSASINANGSFSVIINANTLTLTTALGVASGGTGRNTLATNAILMGNGTGPIHQLMPGSNGQVLQIVGGVPTFGHIDCGYY